MNRSDKSHHPTISTVYRTAFAPSVNLALYPFKVYHFRFISRRVAAMTAQTNRQFLLAKRPVGAATRETFTYQEVPVGTPPRMAKCWCAMNTCPSTRPCVAG